MQFAELMRAGQIAYTKGSQQRAHRIWRRAAMLSPYEEQVWLALLSVVDSNEDRRACLENILVINPRNLQAKNQLSQLTTETQPTLPVEVIPLRRYYWVTYVLYHAVEIILIAVFLASILLFIIYSVVYHF